MIKVQDGAGNILNGLTILDRGYTGHEHLLSVGLINMNGRIYDPQLHRFLQPDNFVQEPGNTQNFNRYGYVLNNPLKYSDPSGEFTWSDLFAAAAIIAGVIVVIASAGTLTPVAQWLIGAGAAHFLGTFAMYANNGFKDWDKASNYIGISSPTISINIDSWFGGGSDKNGINQNEPAVTPKSDTDGSGGGNNGDGGEDKGWKDSYYNALDGIIFNDGSIHKKNDFYLTFKYDSNANAEYLGYKNGKYHINFSIGDYEKTISNIRALTIHEAYGHGYMDYGNDKNNHYKAYQASIDSRYWQSTTYDFKHHTVTQMWSYYYREVGYKPMPQKYMIEYEKYKNPRY